MDDEVGSLASMIAYYLQPMAHRGFSAYNVCKSLLMSVPQRRRWLQEALQAVASAPTESQLLQAALTVLRVSGMRCCNTVFCCQDIFLLC